MWKLIILFFILIFVSGFAFAQNSEEMSWEELDSLIMVDIKAGELMQAKDKAQQALLQAEKLYGIIHYKYLTSFYKILLFNKENYSQFDKALNSFIKNKPKGTLNDIFLYYKMLYFLFDFIQRLEDLEPILDDIDKVNNRYYEFKDSLEIYSLKMLDANEDNKMNQEISYLNKIISIQKILYGDNNDTSLSLSYLGHLYHSIGNDYKAELKLMEALRINKMIFANENENLLNIYNNLAQVYTSLGNFESAELYYKKALILAKKMYPENTSIISVIIQNFGHLLTEMGNYKKAEFYYKEALEMKKKLHTNNNPNYIVKPQM